MEKPGNTLQRDTAVIQVPAVWHPPAKTLKRDEAGTEPTKREPTRCFLPWRSSNASRSLCVLRIAGNFRALQRVHRAVERYWRRMLSSRSWKSTIWWKYFHQIKERTPLLRPKLYLPYAELQAITVL